MQRAQAAVLNTLTESRQFDKIKISKKVKEDKARTSGTPGPHHDNLVDTVGGSTSQDNAQCTARCAWTAAKLDTSRRSAAVGRTGWSMR